MNSIAFINYSPTRFFFFFLRHTWTMPSIFIENYDVRSIAIFACEYTSVLIIGRLDTANVRSCNTIVRTSKWGHVLFGKYLMIKIITLVRGGLVFELQSENCVSRSQKIAILWC